MQICSAQQAMHRPSRQQVMQICSAQQAMHRPSRKQVMQTCSPQQAMHRPSRKQPQQWIHRTGGAPHKPDRTQQACTTAVTTHRQRQVITQPQQDLSDMQRRAEQGSPGSCSRLRPAGQDTAGLQQGGHRQLAALKAASSSMTRPMQTPGSPADAAARQMKEPPTQKMAGRADETRCIYPSTNVQPQTSRTSTEAPKALARGSAAGVDSDETPVSRRWAQRTAAADAWRPSKQLM